MAKSTGDVVSAAEWNAVENFYNVLASRAVDYNVPGDSAAHVITFDSEDFDPLTMHDAAGANPERLVAPVTGYYLVHWHFTLHGAGGGGYRLFRLRRNGTYINYQLFDGGNTVARSCDGSQLVALTAGQYVDMTINTDVAFTLLGDASFPKSMYFGMFRAGV